MKKKASSTKNRKETISIVVSIASLFVAALALLFAYNVQRNVNAQNHINEILRNGDFEISRQDPHRAFYYYYKAANLGSTDSRGGLKLERMALEHSRDFDDNDVYIKKIFELVDRLRYRVSKNLNR